MTPEPNTNPGKYNLKKFLLITDTSVIDISNLFLEINLFEDLFSMSYSGSVVITETGNLPGKEFLLGGERLLFECEILTEDKNEVVIVPIQFLGFITKVSAETSRTGGMTKSYVIDFVSEQHVQNMKTRISKSFVKKSFDEIVKYCFNALKTEANIITERPKSKLDNVIIPNWTPFKAINWCAERSVQSKSRVQSSYSSFIFYQTIKDNQFYFVSIDSLFNKEPEKEIYYFIKDTYDYKTDIRKFVSAENFEVLTNFDLLKTGIEGVYSSTLYEVSVKERKWKKSIFNYKEEFKKSFDSINELPFYSQYLNPFLDSQNMSLYMKSMELGHLINYARAVRSSQLSLLNTHKIKLGIPGSPTISVGSIIDFKYPDFSKDYIREEDALDPTHSGRYLVTSINHYFNPEKYYMLMECVKDSLMER